MADEVKATETDTAGSAAAVTAAESIATTSTAKTKILAILKKIGSAIWTALKAIFTSANIKAFFVWIGTGVKSLIAKLKAADKATIIKWVVGLSIPITLFLIFSGIVTCSIKDKAVNAVLKKIQSEKKADLEKNDDVIKVIDSINNTIQ